jgi:hypothetical protein
LDPRNLRDPQKTRENCCFPVDTNTEFVENIQSYLNA